MIQLLFLVFCIHISCVETMVVRKPNILYKVTSKCNPSPDGLGSITVTADQPITVLVHCKNNYVLQMNTSDRVHYVAYVGFTQQDGSNCVFQRKSSSRIYTLTLDLALASHNQQSAVLMVRDQFMVVCSYDNVGTSKTHTAVVDSSKLPPNSIHDDKGQAITSAIDLQLVDTRGNVLGGDIALGTIVRLLFTVAGADFVKTNQCWARNELRNYTILAAGCGDGVIFKKNDGFRTVNKTIFSPYFSAFRLQGRTDLTFECIVSACPVGVDCDGSSCVTGNRRKRSVNAGIGNIQEGISHLKQVTYRGNDVKTSSTKSHHVIVYPNKNGRVIKHLKNGLVIV